MGVAAIRVKSHVHGATRDDASGASMGTSRQRDSRVTIADVARRAGVSSTTVSFVLSGRDMGISPATADRVVAAARALGYDQTNRVAGEPRSSSDARHRASSPTRSPRTTTAAR